jgi:cytochrome c
MQHSSVPPEVRAALAAKCADCHSSQTRAPLYGWFAPVSWLMERDIVEGRKAMNLSFWDSYSVDRQQALMAKIVAETKAHQMPSLQYRMIHWNAHVTDADVLAFTQWTRGTPTFAMGSMEQASGNGDAARGREVFEKRCTGCHALEKNREGPRLQRVFGRTAGSAPGFTYSPALIKARVVWDEPSLEQWLTDPDAFIPGNNMEFHVPKPQDRRDLIEFLRQGAGPDLAERRDRN